MNKTPCQIRKNNNFVINYYLIIWTDKKRNQLRLKSADNYLHDKFKSIKNSNQRSQDNIFKLMPNINKLNSSMISYDNFSQDSIILNYIYNIYNYNSYTDSHKMDNINNYKYIGVK